MLQLVEAKGAVVVVAHTELAMDEGHEVDIGVKRQFHVGSAIDVVLEYIPHTFLLEVEARHHLVVAAQGRLKLQLHTRHHGVDSLLVKGGEAHAQAAQEAVARMLGVMEIVGVVDDALDVALIVAHIHTCGKQIFFHIDDALQPMPSYVIARAMTRRR